MTSLAEAWLTSIEEYGNKEKVRNLWKREPRMMPVMPCWLPFLIFTQIWTLHLGSKVLATHEMVILVL